MWVSTNSLYNYCYILNIRVARAQKRGEESYVWKCVTIYTCTYSRLSNNCMCSITVMPIWQLEIGHRTWYAWVGTHMPVYHGILLRFTQGSIPESLVNKKSKLTKLFNICWKFLLLKSIKSICFHQTFNNFVSYELLFTKLSGIHPYEKCNK